MRKYDEAGREKIREYLKDCKVVLDIGANSQKIREDALTLDNGIHMSEEDLKEIDYVIDLNNCDHFGDLSVDGICMSHVLEHIIDTRKVLRMCYHALNENGRIAVVVPDGETVPASTLGDSSLTHEMLFTPKTLKLYLEHVGFKNVHTEYYDRPDAYKQTKGIFGCGIK